MRTDKQLRQNSPPNTWESAWVMWRFVDDFHHYYFVLKTNGIEFGKKDTACHCEEQVFLKTGSSPKLQIGSWAHLKISSVGKHTSIWVNGVQVVDMDDPSYSSTGDMSSGAVGLYNEDASVAFDKVSISPQ
jgi:3-keto-disaccharide hydrolase